MLMAAWAKFVIGFNAIHVLSTAVADEQGDRGERLFTLNACAELHHGLNSFGFLTDHALSLQSRSAPVKHFLQRFLRLFFFVFGTRFARANTVPKLFGGLARGLPCEVT